MNSGPGGQTLSLDQTMQKLGLSPAQIAAMKAQMNAGPSTPNPAAQLPPSAAMPGSTNMMKTQRLVETGPGAVPGSVPGSTTGTPFENAAGQTPNTRLGGPGTPSTGTTPLQTAQGPGGATPPPVAPAAWQYQLGNGQSWSPANQQQVADAQQMVGHANAVAVPPSNFARWSNYQPFQGLNTTHAPLQGQGQGGGILGGQQGGGTQPGGGLLGSQPHIPNETLAPGMNSGGQIMPNNSVPGIPNATVVQGQGTRSDTPNGTYADPYAPPTINGVNLSKFSFANPANAYQTNFNNLMKGGYTDQAYNYLFNNGGGMAQALQKQTGASTSDPAALQAWNVLVNHYAGTAHGAIGVGKAGAPIWNSVGGYVPEAGGK